MIQGTLEWQINILVLTVKSRPIEVKMNTNLFRNKNITYIIDYKLNKWYVGYKINK